MFDKYLLFIRNHERLILVLSVLAVAGWLGNKLENLIHDRDVSRNAVAQQQLQEQVKANQALAAQVADLQKTYEADRAQWESQNRQLIASIAQRNQQTTNQQQVDASLSLVELAKRWSGLVGVAQDQIQTSGQNLFASEQASRATVQQLEEVPTLRANVQDQQTVLANKDSQITSLAGLNAGLTSQVGGLQKQIGDADKACKTQIAVVKDEARRAKRKYFIAGFIAGIATRLWFKF